MRRGQDPRRVRAAPTQNASPLRRADLENWAALERICAGTDIPLLPPDALSDDAEVRRYARERDLVLLEVQLL
ncbi:MAG TPA: hypothetical protein VEY13_07370, partial [Rubrobacteraceae bacterium]|nr:hypothetical protein [Rubrobacteraceae bacterium]